MPAIDPVRNFAKVIVSTGYDASAVNIDLQSGEGAKLPAPASEGAFNLVWWNSSDYSDPTDDPNHEIVRCTARSSDSLTITRAQEGTSATTKNTGGKTYKMVLAMTKKTIDDIRGQKGAIHLQFGNGTDNITTDMIIPDISVPKEASVTGWEITGDATGSCVVDIQKSSYASFPSFSSIAGSDKPTLSSAQKNTSTALTGWTTSITKDDYIRGVISSISGLKKVYIKIFITYN